MSMLMHIADRVLNRPLLITPEKASVILQVLSGRIGMGATEASRFEGAPVSIDTNGNAQRVPFNVKDGVGIITITGSLVNRGAWIGANSGLTSYEGIQHQLKTAAAMPGIHAVLLDIQSPGGEAVGAFETAALVRELSAQKRTVAMVNGMAASAAYAIASGADEIVTIETGVSGSIGVVLLHADYSEYLANEGIKPTLIFAGAHKVDGNPYQPLTDAVRSDLQSEVDAFYQSFLKTVASGRGSRLNIDMARATEARALIGQAAVDAGLADTVGTFESVLSDLSRAQGGRSTSQKGRLSMSENTGAPAANIEAGITKADLDAAVAQAIADTKATAKAEADAGVAAERTRLAGLDEVALAAGPGALDIIAAAKLDGQTSPEAAAFAILKAGAHREGAVLSALATDDHSAAGATPAAPGANASVPQTPDGWKAEYANSEKLQGEFTTAEAYVGFKKAEKRGGFKVLGRDAA